MVNIIKQLDRGKGYGVAAAQSFTIGDAADGSAVDPIDLGRNYLYLMVKIEDCEFVAAGTSLTALVSYDEDDTMCDLYELNDPSLQWSKGSLPTGAGETLAFLLSHAVGAQRIRFVLSNNASGGSVVIKVRGLGSGRYLAS